MTSPKHATDSQAGRFYHLPGTDVPLRSVTKVLGVINKPALPAWAAKLAAERAMDAESTWHAIEMESGKEVARKWISAASREYTKKKAAIGSAVHFMCENRDDHTSDFYTENIGRYVADIGGDFDSDMENVAKHYRQFESFIEDNSVNILWHEATVANVEEGYAGTCDGLLEMNGKKYLFDIKTSKSIYATHALQLTAYMRATHVVIGEELKAFDDVIDGALVIKLAPKSYKVQEVRTSDDEWSAFKAALLLDKWNEVPDREILL